MLVAVTNNQRVDAFAAEKGKLHTCPNCNNQVVLKQGKIIIPHFAHKPPNICPYGNGETREHMLSKIIIRDMLRAKDWNADCEIPVFSDLGDRRADVFAEKNKKIAVEIQHTPIPYDNIELRTKAYIAANISVIWIGILNSKMKKLCSIMKEGLYINQYVIRPWEKWAHAYYYGELWFIDPQEKTFWKGSFSDFIIHVEEKSWREDGELQEVGGYDKFSKKWKTLTLKGPFSANDINICFKFRNEWNSKYFNLPKGRYAIFSSNL